MLSAIPFGPQINYFIQRKITKEWPRPAQCLESHRERGATIIDLFRQHSDRPLNAASFVEIGAGRDLALAVALRAAGACHVTCIDINRIAELNLINHAARHFGVRTSLRSWDDLRSFGITYLAPSPAEQTHLAHQSIDCFYTSEVMECIPLNSLRVRTH